MMSCLPNIAAYENFNMINAIGLGYANVKADKKDQYKITKMIRKIIRQSDGAE